MSEETDTPSRASRLGGPSPLPYVQSAQLGEPMIGRSSDVPLQAGGKPNPGTKKDRRLKENQPKATPKTTTKKK